MVVLNYFIWPDIRRVMCRMANVDKHASTTAHIFLEVQEFLLWLVKFFVSY